MSRAVGGYVRRCERVQGTIYHLQENCPDCGLPYAGIRAGTVNHDMTYYHNWPTIMPMPPLSFVPFNVTEPLDTPGITGVESNHEHTTGHHQDRP